MAPRPQQTLRHDDEGLELSPPRNSRQSLYEEADERPLWGALHGFEDEFEDADPLMSKKCDMEEACIHDEEIAAMIQDEMDARDSAALAKAMAASRDVGGLPEDRSWKQKCISVLVAVLVISGAATIGIYGLAEKASAIHHTQCSSSLVSIEDLRNQVLESSSFCGSDISQEDCTCNDPFLYMDSTRKHMEESNVIGDTDAIVSDAIGRKLDVVFVGEVIEAMDDILSTVVGVDFEHEEERTATMNYRLEESIVGALNPAVWWITIGSNDIRDLCSIDAIVAGIRRSIDTIQRQRPASQIVISISDFTGSESSKLEQVKHRIACMAEHIDHVEIFDPAPEGDDDFFGDAQYTGSTTTSGDLSAAIVKKIVELS